MIVGIGTLSNQHNDGGRSVVMPGLILISAMKSGGVLSKFWTGRLFDWSQPSNLRGLTKCRP